VSLHFPYKRFRVNRPLVSLPGQTERPRPVITVALVGPLATATQDGLLDSGADDTLFPEALAAQIGIDLSAAPVGSGAGVGMQAVAVRYARVRLRIADLHEQREWEACVGFTQAPLHRPLLGYAGFLQFFTATFHGDRQEVELTVNGSYPGK
jgi:hypothetical protein